MRMSMLLSYLVICTVEVLSIRRKRLSLKEKRKLSEYPPRCLYLVPESGKLVLIIRGEQGYFEVEEDEITLTPRKEGEMPDHYVRRVNQLAGIVEELERDMVGCSMFNQWPDPEPECKKAGGQLDA